MKSYERYREKKIYDYFMGYEKVVINEAIRSSLISGELKRLNDYYNNPTEENESYFKNYLVPKISKYLKRVYSNPSNKRIKEQKKKRLERERIRYNATHCLTNKMYGFRKESDLQKAIRKYRETHADELELKYKYGGGASDDSVVQSPPEQTKKKKKKKSKKKELKND